MQIIKGRCYNQVRSFDSLREMLDQCVKLYGPLPAFLFRENLNSAPVSKSYLEFHADCQALGTALINQGLAGCRVAIIGENSYQWCLAHIAVLNGVGISVPLDRMLPEDELLTLLKRSEADAVIYDASFHAVMQKAASLLPGLRCRVCIRSGQLKDETAVDWTNPVSPDGLPTQPALFRLQDLLDHGQRLLDAGNKDYQEASIDTKALASLIFTSGTTSSAKAVMLSHHNICSDIRGVAGIVALPVGFRLLSVLPLHHTFENTCGLFVALYVGGTICECDGLRYIQKNLQEYKIDMIIGVPILFENFYNKIQETLKKTGKEKLVRHMISLTRTLRRIGIDLRRVVFKEILASFGGRLSMGICGAAPINPEIISFFDAIGVMILQGYGLTETSPVVSGCHVHCFVPGTVGQPLPGVEVAIDSENAGDPGEILVRGPIVMLGYYQDEAATAEVIGPDGWFHTGDIGRIDPQKQTLSITGRVKSMIVLKSGKKVFPEEIEYLISQHDFIKESMVWGDKDDDGEVVICAKFVVDKDNFTQKTGKSIDDTTIRQQLEQLIRDINASMPSFKGIRQFVFSFQEMVKTTTLKVRRPIEIAKISEIMQDQELKWRELTGLNLDRIREDKPKC